MKKKSGKVLLTKGGRSKNSISARVTIPKTRLNKMDITQEKKDILLYFKQKEMLISSPDAETHYKSLEKRLLELVSKENFEVGSNSWTLKNLKEDKSYFFGYKDTLQILQENKYLEFEKYVIELTSSLEECFEINIRFEARKPELTKKGKEYLESLKNI